ncbi:CDP-diacylglycerol--serine O-phosphatidyltransferase [bacterium]|nr:CDP-diacylglycerol--serine O-phosphatidyltransferase [bacterium]
MLCNIVTLANLFCGIVAICSAVNDQYIFAAWMIIVAVGLDMLDGKIARAFGTGSDLGKNLDSLSDLVSFGVAPFVLVYVLNFQIPGIALVLLSAYLLCGVWRLAKFNSLAGDQPKAFFEGLPIPGAGGVIASTMLVFQKINFGFDSNVLLILAVILAILMISKIKYPVPKQGSIFKRKYTAGIIVVLICLVTMPTVIIWLGFIVYVFLSPLVRLRQTLHSE